MREEDIEIAPDFFEYFIHLSPLLDSDPTVYCISGWNDNGKAMHVKDPGLLSNMGLLIRIVALYRTDFFPGLGWMMTRTV